MGFFDYYYFMMKGPAKIILLLAMLGLCFSCSHNSPSGPQVLREGTIFFANESFYSLILTRLVQTHNGQTLTRTLNNAVYPHSRNQLTNIFTNSSTFPGGDRVAVSFYSRSYDPHNPNPLYSDDITFTVNGPTIVKVSGQDRYEISGN
jgi:hypothetical protein